MRKNSARLVGAAATALLGMTAWAGLKYTRTVSVTLGSNGSGSASGSLADARNSPDSVQYIGCETYVYGGSPEVLCWAQASNGVFGSCYSSNPAIVAALQSIKGDSELGFNWNSSSECTFVSVANHSYLAPKNP
ncbi:hypothetical protein [Archangium violaceum]|uniref:Uncharacterized protein n=1 Tax=Archangium violaceum Cb vi76 TaxID=1406225 RepID=A0A084SQB2_9BACT|nr:hypothetical protein [Archangium violaceum]KFA90647.1 hypothetical protein Q664_27045 [Archangium violaceum Cb vi76]